MQSNSDFDVVVTHFVLQDDPARLTLFVMVKNERFYTRIIYESIASWDQVWARSEPPVDPAVVLGAVAAWDCMRFLALGGEAIHLCDGLTVDENTRAMWRHCFLHQYGEWRYRNNFIYRSADLPDVRPTGPAKGVRDGKPSARRRGERWLITNGGGKDSLVGLLLLNEAKVEYDVYEACLPLGGVAEVQYRLLERLRNAVVPSTSGFISVRVEDDFLVRDDGFFAAMGVTAAHCTSDFAVGHTANYVGFFPLILYHGYSRVLFNIEASSDRAMAQWNGESISHQWCKSTEYQRLSSELFCRLTKSADFHGFASTLRGLYDTMIYALAATEQALLKVTHSCNVQKPWCLRCPKCCFSYLMLASFLGDVYARDMMGATRCLFDEPDNASNWSSLLDKDKVAWECVASHEECLLAVRRAVDRGIRHPLLMKYRSCAVSDRPNPNYETVDWPRVIPALRSVTLARVGRMSNANSTEVAIIGGGQSGLSMSYVLKEAGIAHIVLEAASEGSSWEQRWESFRLNTPNRSLALPGAKYEGTDPDGFATKDDVRQFLRDYSERNELPVIRDTAVLELRRQLGGFASTTQRANVHSRAVVIATGEYGSPKWPRCAKDLPRTILSLHSSQYVTPDSLPQGSVLVVGGGQSGAQIVEDLVGAGRKVIWSLSDRPSNVRRLHGKDFMEWWLIGGLLHRHVSDDPEVRAGGQMALRRARTREFPLVSGTDGVGRGHSISLQRLANAGVELLGKLTHFANGAAYFLDAAPQVQRAIAGTVREYQVLSDIANQYYGGVNSSSMVADEFIPPEIHSGWRLGHTPPCVSLNTAGISTVIFATGFVTSRPWLKIDGALDDLGYPLGTDGVSPIHGLFFIGLFNLQRLSSTCLCNAGIDARHLLPHLKHHLLSHTPPREFVWNSALSEVPAQ